MGAFIGHAIASMDANDGQAMLGNIFVNVIGNIPQEKWDEMKAAAQLPCECGDPACTEWANAFFTAGEIARKRFTHQCPTKPDDEKGFSA